MDPQMEGERRGARSWSASATSGDARQLPPPLPPRLTDKKKGSTELGARRGAAPTQIQA